MSLFSASHSIFLSYLVFSLGTMPLTRKIFLRPSIALSINKAFLFPYYKLIVCGPFHALPHSGGCCLTLNKALVGCCSYDLILTGQTPPPQRVETGHNVLRFVIKSSFSCAHWLSLCLLWRAMKSPVRVVRLIMLGRSVALEPVLRDSSNTTDKQTSDSALGPRTLQPTVIAIIINYVILSSRHRCRV